MYSVDDGRRIGTESRTGCPTGVDESWSVESLGVLGTELSTVLDMPGMWGYGLVKGVRGQIV